MAMPSRRVLYSVLLVWSYQCVFHLRIPFHERQVDYILDCVGVFQAYYQAVTLREYSPSTIAWISSLMIFFMFFFGPIIGM